jgi:hypothetical protein
MKQVTILQITLLTAFAGYLFLLVYLFKDSQLIKNLTGVFLILTLSGFIKERFKK